MKKRSPASERLGARSRRGRRACATSDILAGVSPDWGTRREKGIHPAWARQYEKLIELRAFLLHQQEQLTEEAHAEIPASNMHPADSATDSFDRDFAVSLLSSEQNALYEIDEALNRIKNGTYGICELTGKPIPRARLSAIPWARFSVEAQRKLEQEGTLPRPRLAGLGTVQNIGATEAEDDAMEEGGVKESGGTER